MRWFWGTVLIVIGLIYLGLNFGWWNAETIASLWQLWPLLIILFGLSLIVRHWALGWLIILLAFITSGVFVYYASLSITSPEIESSNFTEGLPSGLKKAKVEIQSRAINLNISGDSDKLAEGKAESSFIQPKIETKIIGDEAKLTIKTELNNFKNWSKVKNKLEIKLTSQIPLDIEIDAGASSLNLDLSDIKLNLLNIKAGASSIDLKIGSKTENNAEIKIDSGASTLNIQIPKELGAQIKTNTPFSSRSIEGFSQTDSNTYQSENYKSTSTKINMNINAGVSTIKIMSY